MEASGPTCYRHPDRRAGVRCQRCERAICPDCMRQASVGFHCPECTRSGAQKVVRARNLNSGGMLITNLLIAVNLAIFVAGIGSGGNTKATVVDRWGLVGTLQTTLGTKVPGFGVGEGEWYRIVTAGFLHANVIHVALNCFVLYQLGRMMEPVLGRIGFSLCYAFALVSGSLGVLVLEPHQFTVGASGAIFGIMGAAVAAMRSRGIDVMQSGLGATIFINLLLTFSIRGISIGGHVGGLIGGFVAGWILTDFGPKQWRNPVIPQVIVVVLGAAVAGACLAI